MVGIMVVDGPLRNFGGFQGTSELEWNPGNMVPGRPGKPAEPDPNPQSCDIGCSLVEKGVTRDG